jgi:mono/diheme cytochrome c family protein
VPAEPKKGSPATLILVLLVFFGAAIALMGYAALQWNIQAKERNLRNPVVSTPAAVAAGKQIYQQHCQSCHGSKGDGKGQKAPELSTAPGDFTDAAKMSGLTDGELYSEVTEGHHPMPAFKDKLIEEQRWQVVDYIRTFANRPAIPTPTPTTAEGAKLAQP